MLNRNDVMDDQFAAFKVAWAKVIELHPEVAGWLPPLDSPELLACTPEYCARQVQRAIALIKDDEAKGRKIPT